MNIHQTFRTISLSQITQLVQGMAFAIHCLNPAFVTLCGW